MSEQAVAVVKGLYEAFAQGNVPAVLGGLSPEIEWTEAPGFPLAGTYVGPDALLSGVFMRLATEWRDFAVVPEEFIDGGDTVVVLGHYRGTYVATGRAFRAECAHVWRVRDGQAYRFHQYVDTAMVNAALAAE